MEEFKYGIYGMEFTASDPKSFELMKQALLDYIDTEKRMKILNKHGIAGDMLRMLKKYVASAYDDTMIRGLNIHEVENLIKDAEEAGL